MSKFQVWTLLVIAGNLTLTNGQVPAAAQPQNIQAQTANAATQAAIPAAGSDASSPDQVKNMTPDMVLAAIDATAKRFDKSLHDMLHEVQRRYGKVQYYPYVAEDLGYVDPVFSDGIMWPMFPSQGEILEQGEPMPPRKQWLDYYMVQITHLVPILQNEVNDISFNAAQQGLVKVDWEVMQSNMATIAQEAQQLTALTKGPQYDNTAIAKQCLKLHEDIKGLLDIRKTVLRKLHSS